MIWKWSGLMFINFLTNGTLCVKDNLIPVRYRTLYVKGGLVLLGLIEYDTLWVTTRRFVTQISKNSYSYQNEILQNLHMSPFSPIHKDYFDVWYVILFLVQIWFIYIRKKIWGHIFMKMFCLTLPRFSKIEDSWEAFWYLYLFIIV